MRIVTLTLLIFNFTASNNYADNEIKETAAVKYSIDEESNLSFTYDIELSVTEDNITAISWYAIKFPFPDMHFETLTSGDTEIEGRQEVKDGVTKLAINLNDKILSTNRPIKIKLEGNIEGDFIKKTQNNVMFSINSNIGNIKPNSMHIQYPKTFGDILPTTTKWNKYETNEEINLRTRNVPLIINLIWGDNITYNFQINKHLSNGENEPVKTFDITIPRAHLNQHVTISQIVPTPNFAYQDKEGNIYVSYHLEAGSDMRISIEGQITHSEKPLKEKLNPFVRPLLAETKGYWKLDNKYELRKFQSYLKRNGISEDSIDKMPYEEKAKFYKLAYSYVIERLQLTAVKATSMESDTRQGADNAIKQDENAVPEDFVDLLTALYRSYDVPTKMIEGYMVQKDSFFHTWLKYWDERYGWKMVDPALEDLTSQNYFGENFHNHIVILTRGYDFLTPRPTLFTGDDFKINLADAQTVENLAVENKLILNPIKKMNNEVMGRIRIKNTGNTVISMQNFSNQYNLNFGIINELQVIVPNQTIIVPFIYTPLAEEIEQELGIKYTSINGQEIINPLSIETEEVKYWWWDILVTITTFIIIWVIIYIVYLSFTKIMLWTRSYYQ